MAQDRRSGIGSRQAGLLGLVLATTGLGCGADRVADATDSGAGPADTGGAEGSADAGSDTAPAPDTVEGSGQPMAPLEPCGPGPATLSTLRLTVDGTVLRDALGREVMLRGANAGGRSKLPPFVPFAFAESGLDDQVDAPRFDEAADAFYARLAGYGFNVVRLLLLWEGLEPVRGSYDETYLARLRGQIEAAQRHGIRVFIDAHQDLWSRAYCGDGAPVWTLPDPDRPVPDPADCEGWFNGYVSDPDGVVRPAFDRLWTNADGVRDAYREMWRHVAEQTRDLDAVIAYEPINEPYQGTIAEKTWGEEVLPAFFEEMAGAIRAAAPGAPVVFGSSGLDGADQSFSLRVPGGGNMVWGPHFYDPRSFLGIPIDERYSVSRQIAFLRRQAATFGTPVILGEFGANTTLETTPIYLRKVYDALDEQLMGATVWHVSLGGPEWNQEFFGMLNLDGSETPSLEAVVRPYPRATAGRPVAFAYDALAGVGRFDWQASPGVTELSAPARLFGSGIRLTAAGEGLCGGYDPSTGLVRVRSSAAGPASLGFERVR